jgi:thioredoxin reductase (NADPH)
VEIGANPDAAVAKDLGIEIDDRGYIKVNDNTKTNVPGVYSAGDVTDADAHFDQIISAEAQGGLAARAAFYFLNQKTSANQEKVSINHVI